MQKMKGSSIDKKAIYIYSVMSLLSLALLFNGCQQAHDEINALPFQNNKNGEWGLIGIDGNILVPAGTFKQEPSTVVNGMFSLPVSENQRQIFQAKEPTQPVSPRLFTQIGHFFEEVTIAQETPDSPILVIDKKGNTVNDIGESLHYDIVLMHNFSEGRALFCTRKGKYGFIDTKGKIIIAPIYDYACDFHEGTALVGNADEKGDMNFQLIDANGKTVLNIQLPSSFFDERFGNGLLMYSNMQSGRVCYMDKKGITKIYLPDSVRTAFRFRHHAAIVQTDKGMGLINHEGAFLITPQYKDMTISGDNRICVLTDEGWKLTDFRGAIKGNGTYKHPVNFYSSNLAVSRIDSLYQWIDKEGVPVDNRQYFFIKEDTFALKEKPQVFVRQQQSKRTEEENAPKDTVDDRKRQDIIKEQEHEKREEDETDETDKVTTTTLNGDEWKNISKQSPFYAEAGKILSGKLPEEDAENIRMILNYVEHLRTSYTTKDIDFLNQLFSEDALIIVGKVIRNAPKRDGQLLPQEKVEYNIKNKRAYLERLTTLFKMNKKIDLEFSDFKIMKHPTQKGLYGVTLRQKYTSDLYSDDGYLFLLWDFRDETTPLIHIRTWQPRMIEEGVPLSEQDIFSISNFNLQ